MIIEFKYPWFEFREIWFKKINTMGGTDVQLAMYHAIEDYAFFEWEPTKLSGDALDYFNEVVRPDLDNQHDKFNEYNKHKGKLNADI